MTTTPTSIHDLPELPVAVLSVGGRLGHSPTEPVITIRPPVQYDPQDAQSNQEVEPLPHCPPVAERYVRKYLTQVLYPRVTCYPFTAPSDQVLERAIAENRRNEQPEIGAPANRFDQRTMYYKLSTFEGVELGDPYFCTVHGGPWSATVVETQSCQQLAGCIRAPSTWIFEVNGIPELGLVWQGVWEDIPAHLHPTMTVLMNDLHLVDQEWSCCPGFRRCDPQGPCIAWDVRCPDQNPA